KAGVSVNETNLKKLQVSDEHLTDIFNVFDFLGKLRLNQERFLMVTDHPENAKNIVKLLMAIDRDCEINIDLFFKDLVRYSHLAEQIIAKLPHRSIYAEPALKDAAFKKILEDIGSQAEKDQAKEDNKIKMSFLPGFNPKRNPDSDMAKV